MKVKFEFLDGTTYTAKNLISWPQRFGSIVSYRQSRESMSVIEKGIYEDVVGEANISVDESLLKGYTAFRGKEVRTVVVSRKYCVKTSIEAKEATQPAVSKPPELSFCVGDKVEVITDNPSNSLRNKGERGVINQLLENGLLKESYYGVQFIDGNTLYILEEDLNLVPLLMA